MPISKNSQQIIGLRRLNALLRVLGSARKAIHHFQQGRDAWGRAALAELERKLQSPNLPKEK